MSFDSSSLPTLETVSPSGMSDTTLPVMSPSVIIGHYSGNEISAVLIVGHMNAFFPFRHKNKIPRGIL